MIDGRQRSAMSGMDRRMNGWALRWGRVEGMQGEDRWTGGSRGGGGWRSGWVGWTDGHVIDGRQRSVTVGWTDGRGQGGSTSRRCSVGWDGQTDTVKDDQCQGDAVVGWDGQTDMVNSRKRSTTSGMESWAQSRRWDRLGRTDRRTRRMVDKSQQ